MSAFEFLKRENLLINKDFYAILEETSFLKKLKEGKELGDFFKEIFSRKKNYRKVKGYRVGDLEIYLKFYLENFKEAKQEWQNILWFWERGFPTSIPILLYETNQAVILGTKKFSGRLCLDIIKEKPQAKEIQLSKIAEFLAKLHKAGLFHQDCYLNHFYFEEENQTLYVIDVARVLNQPKFSFYYHLKDLAQLTYSFKEYFEETWQEDWKLFFNFYEKFWGRPWGFFKKWLIFLKVKEIERRTERRKRRLAF